ncbi:MAG: hypothetical protein SO061_01225 [Limosilactobacillus coleohominis]|uniref:hypothetical protein n=1 Tax=Limosilactobacillus coleohominis TaxID=181675 RepID=UPI002A810C79|nr:hypothetical protein [Limosilactobacillus coleohominis]MCI5812400.1 hypothetical protein [Lactobacillus sp.]MDY3702165.1 hypothetical protein [Limosilactobacillus coleohominis]MDY5629273.1 hypothetical protein [Limosilactobacillus coleohominis]
MSNEQMVSTATEKVQALSDSLTDGLRIGEQYVGLLNDLCQKTDPQDLLSAVMKLNKINLSSPFVKFPQHYEPADYYLLFMGRLLELGNIQGMTLEEDNVSHRLSMACQHLSEETKFKFELDRNNGGAFFTEQEKHEPLFYINLEKKVLRFSNRALVNFFVIREAERYSDLDIQATLKILMDFTEILANELDFVNDLGILNPSNDVEFPLQAPELNKQIIDKLFVKTTDTDFMLLSMPKNNGALLNLDRQIRLTLFYDPDDYSQQWKFKVVDPDQQYSFFDVLLHYSIIREWYLNNREALAVRSDPLIFAD